MRIIHYKVGILLTVLCEVKFSDAAGNSENFLTKFGGIAPASGNHREKRQADTFSDECPETEGKTCVFVEGSDCCYPLGERGPCPQNMVLFPRQGSTQGYCDCNCDIYYHTLYHTSKRFCKGTTSKGLIRTLAFVSKFKSCQPIFERGKCRKGKWLVFDDNSEEEPKCKPAECGSSRYNLEFIDNKGKCRRVGDKCQSPLLEPLGETTYQIQDTDWIPVCSLPMPDPFQHNGQNWQGANIPMTRNRCGRGRVYSPTKGGCVPTYEADDPFVG